MPDVIFARPRYEYDSYRDLYRLIALSGYPLIFFDEMDAQSDNCYIMTLVNGENNAGYPDARARLILWDLEWRLDGDYQRLPGVSEVWASDQWYAEQIGAKYVPLGSHEGLALNAPNGQSRPYDAAMLSYMTYRRMCIYDQLTDRGMRMAPNGWGVERDAVLNSSKLMLHVHQNENAHTVAPQRFALAAAYGLPLVSEALWQPGIFQEMVLQADYTKVAETVRSWRDDARTQAYGQALHDCLCHEYTFRRCVEAAV